jgi:hypothetical protein
MNVQLSPTLLLSALVLSAGPCLAQQGHDEQIHCPAGQIPKDSQCIPKKSRDAQSIDEPVPPKAPHGASVDQAVADEPAPVSHHKPKPPHITECPELQMLKDGHCVPMSE